MTWIKEANKLGKFIETYKGYRIYQTKPVEVKTSVVEKDGELWRRADIIPGEYVAIDKSGYGYRSESRGVIRTNIDLYRLKKPA